MVDAICFFNITIIKNVNVMNENGINYSNFANLIYRKRKRQRKRPLVMTIVSLRFKRGDYSISSLTWASCVAYLSGRQRRPEFEVSKSNTPTSFY